MGIHPRAAASLSLRECKVRASLLLKDLLAEGTVRPAQAAERLRVLPAFAPLTASEVLTRRESVRRKHALAVIAHEHGHASWVSLKQALGEEDAPSLDTEAFFQKHRGTFLNRWFGTYPEALASLQAQGGYLFPFREQFFLCEGEFLRALGVDPLDPDWARMGFNWVAPSEPAAQQRLLKKLSALGYAG
jgi:hypothetical protein